MTFKTDYSQYVVGNNQEQGAHDGTDVIASEYATEEAVSRTDGSTFTLKSLDIGLSFYTQPTDTVTLTLNDLGGGTSTSVLALSQDFQTVTLNAANLTSVDFGPPAHTGYIALDNIVYADGIATPEPSTMLPVSIASLMGLVYGWRHRKTKPVPAGRHGTGCGDMACLRNTAP